ncbi:MAG: DHH family phosphoesterase [Rikenellaceae bacterium]
MENKKIQFLTSIEQCSKVSIVTHINPDGDALGSAIAMATLLDCSFNKEVKVFTPNRSADYLKSIKGFDYVNDYLASTKSSIDYIRSSDLIICVDLYDYNTRTGEISVHIAKNEKAKKIVFDHHVFNDLNLYDLTICDSGNSSASNLILQTLREFGMDDMIDLQIAEAIYTGMMTDTGNFSFGNLNPVLYDNISFLVSKGVVTSEVNSRIFNVKRESAVRLTGYATSKKLYIDYKKEAAVITLTKEELNKYGYTSGDTEGLVNVPLSINGIYNSALFMEQEGSIKVSLRSDAIFGGDTNALARKLFNGGGHINASGGKAFDMGLKECMQLYFDNVSNKN